MKNSLDNINGILKIAEESSKFEDISIEMIQIRNRFLKNNCSIV